MSDYLSFLPEAQVAAWYRRLADRIAQEKVGGQEPLAALFLRHWLDNRNSASTFQFPPPRYLQTSSYVVAVLQYHRAVFLTEQKARVGKTTKWAGVLPRIQGLSGVARWDLARPLDMQYESLVEVGTGLIDLVRIQQTGTREERDLLTSLRGFQLQSRVTVTGKSATNGRIVVEFSSWKAQAMDRYDWNYSEHFTVPNPDYRSKQPGAVRPGDPTLTVYHRNAERLERASLAAPYNVVSHEWLISDPLLLKPGEVDLSRKL